MGMSSFLARMITRPLTPFTRARILLLLCAAAGCANVQVMRLTSETFPARDVQDVAILSQFPSAQYEKIAELSETSSSDNVAKLQRHVLEKAAELGADAVVFSTPITHRAY